MKRLISAFLLAVISIVILLLCNRNIENAVFINEKNNYEIIEEEEISNNEIIKWIYKLKGIQGLNQKIFEEERYILISVGKQSAATSITISAITTLEDKIIIDGKVDLVKNEFDNPYIIIKMQNLNKDITLGNFNLHDIYNSNHLTEKDTVEISIETSEKTLITGYLENIIENKIELTGTDNKKYTLEYTDELKNKISKLKTGMKITIIVENKIITDCL